MVYTEHRSFKSVEALLASAKSKHYWWSDEVVTFEKGDCGFVEIIGKTVTVGWPAYYRYFRFNSYSEALFWAERVHSDWEKSDKTNWRDFVDKVL